MRDRAIEDLLLNYDESEYEEEGEDDLENLELEPEGVVEELVPREADGEDWDSSDDEPLTTVSRSTNRRSTNRPLRWDRTEDFNNSGMDEDPPLESDFELRDSLQYFHRYINPSLFEVMSDCTNISSVIRSGNSLNTTPTELKTFIGCSMAMSILGLPRFRMFWAAETRVNLIAQNFTRNRYFKLRANIKVVQDHTVTDVEKEVDRFWKIRPIVSGIEQGCRENKRERCVAIDEQMMPFTGKCKLKQVVKGKPNPEGIKIFLMANPNGLPLDLYLYQGKGTSIESAMYPTPEKIDLGGRVVLKLADTLPQETSIYFDRYFTSILLLDTLSNRRIHGTGTLMKNRVPEYRRPTAQNRRPKTLLKSDRSLQTSGRGSYDCVVRQDKKLAVIKWLDSKPIHLASTENAVQPLGTCRRWSKKDQRYLDVPQPAAVKKYNSNMGGIDLLDRVIGKYAMRGRTGKWTVRAIFHFFDFAAAAAWIEYRQDAVKCGLPRKKIMQYLDFKMDLAKHLIYGGVLPRVLQCSSPSIDRLSRNSPRQSPGPTLPEMQDVPPSTSSNRRHRLVAPIPHTAKRVREAQHLPICAKTDQNNRSKCRLSGCKGLTFIKCSECEIYLCLNVNRNCFYDFHTNNN